MRPTINVVDGRGNAYINNQGFAFPGGEFAPGTIALLPLTGRHARVADSLAFPNGMAVTAPVGRERTVASKAGCVRGTPETALPEPPIGQPAWIPGCGSAPWPGSFSVGR